MRGRGRQQALLKLLLQHEDYVQASRLAAALSVSTKTIMRTLTDVDEELSRYDLKLIRRAGSGYRIEGRETGRRALLVDLSQEVKMPLSKEARHRAILSKVLPAKEPIKLYAIAAELGVTDGTISADLDALVDWMDAQGLQLVRRPGLGIYVRGSEANRRRAIVRTIYEGIGTEPLLQLTAARTKTAVESRTEARLLGLVDAACLRQLEGLVRGCEEMLPAPFSDDAFVGLVVHLAIALDRIVQGEDIEMAEETLAHLKTHREYAIALQLAEAIKQVFDLDISGGEVGYITMHLLGARNRYSPTDGSHMLDNFRLVQLARQLMKRAGVLANAPLMEDAALLQGLVNHLGPSISRLELSLDIRNPLQAEMERVYPELMELAKESVRPVEEAIGQTFPQAEIAYIAMHLGAALRNHKHTGEEKRRVVVSCPTGMGTSRLLASRLRETCKALDIVAEVSVLELTDAYLDALEVDFLISMVPLEHVTYPFVVVSPLLTAEDRARIDACLALLPPRRGCVEVCEKPQATMEMLTGLGRTAMLAAGLAERFFLRTATKEEDIYTLAVTALMETQCVGGTDAAGKMHHMRGAAFHTMFMTRIVEALRQREANASTLSLNGRLRILHARVADAPFAVGLVREAGAGIVHLVLLAPTTANDVEIALLGAIPSALGKEENLFSVLQEGGYEEVRTHAVRIFRDFLQQQYFS